ncbi:MAG: methylmalonyl-CoA mutase [Methylobacteriaceae bacterium]|jgi:methylmalonyl-CoA mutase|nr:methylmalonyl-CoA mutase [Methylobacteriaceae bacterium]
MPEPDMPFADAFPPAGEAQWRKLVDGVLKGKSFETLVAKTYDDVAIAPLYSRLREEKPRAIRSAPGPWLVVQRVDNPDPVQANKQALSDLQNGASGLQLVFAGSGGDYGFGLPNASDETIAQVLDGVYLETGINIELDLGAATRDAAEKVAHLVAARGIDPALTNIVFGLNPLGAVISGALTAEDWPSTAPRFAQYVRSLADRGFTKSLCVANARLIHAAGGSEVQELAFALASAVTYLRALDANGIDLDAARKMISFRLASDTDQFCGIAKSRALRRLWARVEEACGLMPTPLHLHAETAWRMMTRNDPHVNLLRTTMAVFSAALGGADSISVLPFTQALGLPDAAARRLARNTQLVLSEESNLDKVSDPAAGSGGYEALTSEFCERAWDLFQQIEKQGGLHKALASGSFQSRVAETRARRRERVARRLDPLTGASEFPILEEVSVSVLKPLPPSPETEDARTLPRIRLAEPFERLRAAADANAERAGRPTIFLANLGSLAAFAPRAMFAKNFFAAGGIAAIDTDGFDSPQRATAAFKASDAKLACICSNDSVYAEKAVATARALADAGAKGIYVAGRPRELEAQLAQAGVTDFIYAGCDVLRVLEEAQRRIA